MKLPYSNMRGNTIRNVGTPLKATDAMTFAVPSYTTTEKQALPVITNGIIVYDLTLKKIQGYQDGTWVNLA